MLCAFKEKLSYNMSNEVSLEVERSLWDFNYLENKDNRKARFICDIILLNVEKEPLLFEGIAEGYIADAPLGEGGFGYDPIFHSTEVNKRFSELTQEEKNKVSHRGKALLKLLTYLRINHQSIK